MLNFHLPNTQYVCKTIPKFLKLKWNLIEKEESPVFHACLAGEELVIRQSDWLPTAYVNHCSWSRMELSVLKHRFNLASIKKVCMCTTWIPELSMGLSNKAGDEKKSKKLCRPLHAFRNTGGEKGTVSSYLHSLFRFLHLSKPFLYLKKKKIPPDSKALPSSPNHWEEMRQRLVSFFILILSGMYITKVGSLMMHES